MIKLHPDSLHVQKVPTSRFPHVCVRQDPDGALFDNDLIPAGMSRLLPEAEEMAVDEAQPGTGSSFRLLSIYVIDKNLISNFMIIEFILSI